MTSAVNLIDDGPTLQSSVIDIDQRSSRNQVRTPKVRPERATGSNDVKAKTIIGVLPPERTSCDRPTKRMKLSTGVEEPAETLSTPTRPEMPDVCPKRRDCQQPSHKPIDWRVFLSPARNSPAPSQFLQGLGTPTRRDEGTSMGRKTKEFASCIARPEGGTEVAYRHLDNPVEADTTTSGPHRHGEDWLHGLSPEIVNVYRALQDVNKNITLQLARSAEIMRAAGTKWYD